MREQEERNTQEVEDRKAAKSPVSIIAELRVKSTGEHQGWLVAKGLGLIAVTDECINKLEQDKHFELIGRKVITNEGIVAYPVFEQVGQPRVFDDTPNLVNYENTVKFLNLFENHFKHLVTMTLAAKLDKGLGKGIWYIDVEQAQINLARNQIISYRTNQFNTSHFLYQNEAVNYESVILNLLKSKVSNGRAIGGIQILSELLHIYSPTETVKPWQLKLEYRGYTDYVPFPLMSRVEQPSKYDYKGLEEQEQAQQTEQVRDYRYTVKDRKRIEEERQNEAELMKELLEMGVSFD